MNRLVLCLGAALMTAAVPATADRALVIGASEEQRRGFLRGTSDEDTADALRRAGFEVFTADAGSVAAMRAALSAFMRDLSDEERAVVHLSGRFLQGDGRSWLLQTELEHMPDLATIDDVGLSLETVLAVAARLPGRSVVALGQETGGDAPGEGLQAGLGDAEVPQGVSLVRGPKAEVAEFVAGPLLQEGRSLPDALATARGIAGQGFLSPHVVFLPSGAERPVAPPNAAEVERALWQAAQARDSVAGYEGYLERYPNGFFEAEAEAAIERIRTEPGRQARLAEDALKLSAGQRRQIQQQLSLLGHSPGVADGVLGPASRAAIKRFQQSNGFPTTGYLNARQIDRVALQAEKRQAAIDAEERRAKLLREKADRETWAALDEGADEAGLRTYLDRYPDGLYAPIAKERLARIDAEAKAASEALDQRDWSQARAADTAPAYRAYLEAHPNGAKAKQARKRLAELRGPNVKARAAAREAEAALGLTLVSRMVAEQRLAQLGLDPGTVDGTFDKNTRAAIRRFQKARNLEVTGFLDQQTASAMLANL